MINMNVLILSILFSSVKLTELPPVLERAAYSAGHLQLYCLLWYVCPSFHTLWVLIRLIPEVFLLI